MSDLSHNFRFNSQFESRDLEKKFQPNAILQSAKSNGFIDSLFAQPDQAPQCTASGESEMHDIQPTDFEQGFAAGMAAAQIESDAKIAQLQKLVQTASCFQPQSSEEITFLIAKMMDQLVEQLFAHVDINRDWLNAQIAKASAILLEADSAQAIVLHPLDAALLDPSAFALPIQSDAALARGDIRIMCSTGWIETGTSVFLDQMQAALGTGDMSS